LAVQWLLIHLGLSRAKKENPRIPRNNSEAHAIREGERGTARTTSLGRLKTLKESRKENLMMTNMFNKLSKSFSRTGSERTSSVRNRRPNRRCSIGLGIEGLEGRLVCDAGAIGVIGVTISNGDNSGQTDTTNQTDTMTLTLTNSTDQSTIF
jgi:hypothetical protein